MDKWDYRFLELAKLISTWSKDPSTQMGAVLVASDRTVISIGFNGFPKAMPDIEESYNNKEDKLSRIIHCEMNACLSAKESLKGATLYTWPFLSCDRCAVHMIQAGIIKLVAPKCSQDKAERWEPYFIKTRKYAKECGVEVIEYG